MIKLLIMSIISISSLNLFAESSPLFNFVIGKYTLIGKSLNSQSTFIGEMELYKNNNQLKFKRVVGNKLIEGDAAIENALGGETEVLKLSYNEGNNIMEQTCLIQSDLDNYARISCYSYNKDKMTINPGMEVMFINNEHRK